MSEEGKAAAAAAKGADAGKAAADAGKAAAGAGAKADGAGGGKADASAKAGTVLDGDADHDVKGALDADAKVSDEWREKWANGNDAVLKYLKRFTSPDRVGLAAFDLRQKMSAGRIREALTADATPEQITAYRKDNGIPEKAEGYLEKLPDGLVIGEADKPYVSKFAEAMHALNAPPQYVHETLKSYYAIQAEQSAAIEEANNAALVEGTERLMDEWGAEFRPNRNAINNLLSGIPEDARKALTGARDEKGMLLFNQPPILKAFAQIARELDKHATVAPGSDGAKALTNELGEIQRLRREKPSEYWAETKAGNDLRARERELLGAQQKMESGRAA